MSAETYTHIQSGWLRAARIGWLVFFAFAVLTLLVAFPVRWRELAHPSEYVLANLNAMGLSVTVYAVASLLVELIFALTFLLVGLLILLRRSDDRMALFTSLTLVAFGIGNQTVAPTVYALRAQPWGEMIFAVAGFVAWTLFTQFPYLFPSGRYVPRWTLIPGLIWIVLDVPWNFMIDSPLYPPDWPLVIIGPLFIFLWASAVVSQVYRYRYVSSMIERQQTKWVMYALALIVASIILIMLFSFVLGSSLIAITSLEEATTANLFTARLVMQLVSPLLFLLLPVAFAFSILRYRLWDIDIIIRRTLVYSLLSGLLGLIYLGIVLVLQTVLTVFGGERSPVVLVVSTLAIAVLFNPLRKRVQAAIDSRFFRSKYQAEQVLAQFALTARDETDLETLTSELERVVVETLQPEHASLWIRPTEID
jgi:hypothetical protein